MPHGKLLSMTSFAHNCVAHLAASTACAVLQEEGTSLSLTTCTVAVSVAQGLLQCMAACRPLSQCGEPHPWPSHGDTRHLGRPGFLCGKQQKMPAPDWDPGNASLAAPSYVMHHITRLARLLGLRNTRQPIIQLEILISREVYVLLL